MKKCEKCGKAGESDFCPDCGGRMAEMGDMTEMPETEKKEENGIVETQKVEEDRPPEEESVKTNENNEGNPVKESLAEEAVHEETPERNKKQKDKSNKKWFARKSFIIPTVLAVLFFFLWMGSPSAESVAELEENLSALQTEYDEYKEEMEAYEGYSSEDLEKAKEIREKEEAEKQKELEEEKKKGYNTGITYDQLARNPEKYEGKKVKFSGKVVQVIEDDDEIQIRLAVNDDYDTIILGGYSPDIVESRILEDDYITIYGVSVGTITYESTMGGNITIPGIAIEKIDQ